MLIPGMQGSAEMVEDIECLPVPCIGRQRGQNERLDKQGPRYMSIVEACS